jgi:hypothetical protein
MITLADKAMNFRDPSLNQCWYVFFCGLCGFARQGPFAYYCYFLEIKKQPLIDIPGQ